MALIPKSVIFKGYVVFVPETAMQTIRNLPERHQCTVLGEVEMPVTIEFER